MNEIDQVLSADAPQGVLSAAAVRAHLGQLPAQPFVPFNDEACRLSDGSAVHLLRRLGEEDGPFVSVCAMDGPDDEGTDARQRLFGWMWSRPDRWTAWGRIAVGLGAGVLARQVERELEEDAPARDAGPADDKLPRLDRPPADDPSQEDGPDDADDQRVWCCCRDDGGYGRPKSYRLFLRRGDGYPELALFTLRFDRAGERDRLWDYMQHQTARYAEFVEHLDAHGSGSLKKLIFRGMLETERAVKKAGMGSGGTRPLRFWPGPETDDA